MKDVITKMAVSVLGTITVVIVMLVLMLLPYGFGYFIGWIIEWLNGSVITILETDLKVWLGVAFILVAVVKNK